MKVKTTEADLLRLRLVFVGAAVFALVMVLALVRALTSGADRDFIAGATLALLACGGVAGLLGLLIWRPIAEATALATRFAAGETDLRLDASRGFASFRRLATVLNGLADHINDRETRFRLVSEATGDAVWRWTPATDDLVWHGKWQTVFGRSGAT